MEFKPHEYQKYAIDFLETHPQAVLMLDMGLGKTVSTLTAIWDLMYETFDISSALVVAPLRVAKYTWYDEVRKWDHLNELTVSVICGTAAQRKAAVEAAADVHIINRENLPWLMENYPGLRYDMIVYDELSSFKNSQAKRFKAAMYYTLRADRVVGLTGTPASNGYMDLFGEYKVIDKGERLGRFITKYRNDYFSPDKTNGHIVYSYRLRDGAEKAIQERISDITVSMQAKDYLKMPECLYIKNYVEMSDKEAKIYKQMKRDLIIPLEGDEEITAQSAAALSNKLIQMANGAVYTDEGGVQTIHDHKLEALADIVEQQNGKPLLVAYWYKHDLARIKKYLSENAGVEPVCIDSETAIRSWNEGKVLVGLIHPASAGHGLNLQSGGSTLCWFGLTWSLELYQQTNARLYRQGQKETTVITHIITKGTMDEAVMQALEQKDTTQNVLIKSVRAEIKND